MSAVDAIGLLPVDPMELPLVRLPKDALEKWRRGAGLDRQDIMRRAAEKVRRARPGAEWARIMDQDGQLLASVSTSFVAPRARERKARR